MRTLCRLCVIAAAWTSVIALDAIAAPRVEVIYVDPAKFTDLRNGYTQTPEARDAYLAALTRYVEREALARMSGDERLTVTITDVQLAGTYEARRPESTNVRIVRDVLPARIDLAFRLDGGDGRVREGTRQLRSNGYPVLVGVEPSDPLLYAKALLDAWLREELAQP